MTTLAAPLTGARVGRDGWLDLAFARRGTATVLARSGWRTPLQVMAPLALDDPACVVSVLNPTGGVVGGDRLAIDLLVGSEAHACVTTPSATKVYRTAGEVAEQHVRLRLDRGATLEWVPDHTIPYADSKYRQRIDADVGPGATLILVDAFAAGRIARGEAWRFAWLESRLSVGDGEGPILHDRFALAGGEAWAGLGFAESHPYFGAIVVVADVDLDGLARELDEAGASVPGATLATARLARRGVVARCLATAAPALGAMIEAAWTAARAAIGRPPLALRKT